MSYRFAISVFIEEALTAKVAELQATIVAKDEQLAANEVEMGSMAASAKDAEPQELQAQLAPLGGVPP